MNPNVRDSWNLSPDSVRLGATIREMRVMRGMTQDQLANAALISRAHLTNIEAGRKKASLITISRIALALRVPQISLVAETYPPLEHTAA